MLCVDIHTLVVARRYLRPVWCSCQGSCEHSVHTLEIDAGFLGYFGCAPCCFAGRSTSFADFRLFFHRYRDKSKSSLGVPFVHFPMRTLFERSHLCHLFGVSFNVNAVTLFKKVFARGREGDKS